MEAKTKKQFIEAMEESAEKLRNGDFFFLDIPGGTMFGNQNYGEVSIGLADGVKLTAQLFSSTEEEKKTKEIPKGEFETDLVYGKRIENLIEITAVFTAEMKDRDLTEKIDSVTWKQKMVEWANEFEYFNKDKNWDDSEESYLEAIEKYAKKAIDRFVKEVA